MGEIYHFTEINVQHSSSALLPLDVCQESILFFEEVGNFRTKIFNRNSHERFLFLNPNHQTKRCESENYSAMVSIKPKDVFSRLNEWVLSK